MSLPLPVRNPDLFNEVARWLCQIPHSRILQIEFIQAERGHATMRLPYQERLIDYLRPATPGLPVYCTAECYRMGREIAFTRATAYQDGNPQPVAYGVATFMRRKSHKGEAVITGAQA